MGQMRIPAGPAGYVLTSSGPGVAPVLSSPSVSGIIDVGSFAAQHSIPFDPTGTTDSWRAFQACVNFVCTTGGTAPYYDDGFPIGNQSNLTPVYHKCINVQNGTFSFSTDLLIPASYGFYMRGQGRNATVLQNVGSNPIGNKSADSGLSVLTTKGLAYGRLEGISFINNPSSSSNGSVCFDFDTLHTAGSQNFQFAASGPQAVGGQKVWVVDCNFGGNGQWGVRAGQSGLQSEAMCFAQCDFFLTSGTGFYSGCQNALSHVFLSGNFQNCNRGINCALGTVYVFGTSFQQSHDWDIIIGDATSDHVSVVKGVRSESLRFVWAAAVGRLLLEQCGQTSSTNYGTLTAFDSTFLDISGQGSIVECWSNAFNIIVRSFPISIRNSSLASAPVFTANIPNTNIVASAEVENSIVAGQFYRKSRLYSGSAFGTLSSQTGNVSKDYPIVGAPNQNPAAVRYLTQTAEATTTAIAIAWTASCSESAVNVTSTVTITGTVGTAAVVNWTAHGLAAGTPVYFTSTGQLPAPLSTYENYYVNNTGIVANSFQIQISNPQIFNGSAQQVKLTSTYQLGIHTAQTGPMPAQVVTDYSIYGFGHRSASYFYPSTDYSKSFDVGSNATSLTMNFTPSSDESHNFTMQIYALGSANTAYYGGTGLGDGASPPAWVPFCLFQTATGASSIGSPRDIPSCFFWLDSGTVSTFSLDGSNGVISWNGKNGGVTGGNRGESYQQSTMANRPIRTAGLINGLAAVRFTAASSTYLEISNPTSVAGANLISWANNKFIRFDANAGFSGATVFVVIRRNSPSNYAPILGSNGGGVNTSLNWNDTSDNAIHLAGLGAVSTNLGHDTNFHMVTIRMPSGFGGNVRLDGVDVTAGGAGALTQNTTSYAGDLGVDSTGVYGDFDLASLIICGTPLCLNDILLVEAYLTNRFFTVPIANPNAIAGCILWLDGADSSGASMTLSGSNVTTWKDKSTGGTHNASNTGNYPTLVTNGLNGQSVVEFANNQFLDFASTFNCSGDATVFIIFRSLNGNGSKLFTGNSADNSSLGYWSAATSGFMAISSTANQYFETVRFQDTVNFYYTSNVFNGASAPSMAVNGAAQTFFSPTAGANTNIFIGLNDPANQASNAHWQVAEIFGYNSVLSPSNTTKAITYIQNKWGY
jgi:hypothetical protein